METGHRARRLEPPAWAKQPDAAAPRPPPPGLTFQSASTSRASSRRPPSVLPRTIQRGICESSCLETSNVICKGMSEPGQQPYCSGARVAAGVAGDGQGLLGSAGGMGGTQLPRRPQRARPWHKEPLS